MPLKDDADEQFVANIFVPSDELARIDESAKRDDGAAYATYDVDDHQA